MGDGYCDGPDQQWGCDLTCYGNDYGDCDDIQGCPEGTIGDCSGDGDCCEASWLGDGYCDGTDQYYGCDLSCYGQDYGDCVAEGCAEGEVQDCADADCCAGSWLGDGYCDGEDQAFGCDLSCYGNDYGDCVDGGCAEGTIQDCADADCCSASWLGDGYCDGVDQAYGCDLSCYGEEFGDCNDMQGCPEGTMEDCSGDGDCCSISWLGDGYCDGTDQYYGCDLSCYGADYGDCAVCPPGMHQECISVGCNCLQGSSSVQTDGDVVAVDDTGILYIVIGCVAGFIALVFCYRMYLKNNNARFLSFMEKDDPYASVGLEDIPVAEAIDGLEDEDEQADENANLVPN